MMEPDQVLQNLVVDHAAVEALRGRFAAELAHRAVRKARPRRPPKVTDLKPLTMRAIAKARSRLSAKYHSLEHILPLTVLDELMVSSKMTSMLSDPDHVRLLLSPLSRNCKMNLPFFTPDYPKPCPKSVSIRKELECLRRKLDRFADVVLNTAKDSIRTLMVGDLTGGRTRPTNGRYHKWGINVPVLRDFLHRLLEGLAELHELAVLNWPEVVNQQTFEILGKRHKNLKRLVVRYPDKYYNRYSDGEDLIPLVSQCTKLEELHVTEKFKNFMYSVPFLSELRTLSTSDPGRVSWGLYTYAEQDPLPSPVKLDTAVAFDLRSNLQDRHEVQRLFYVIPNVTNVSVSDFTQETITGLIEINNPIKTLKLIEGRVLDLNTQRRLMERFSESLTHLSITSSRNNKGVWDLGVIAQNCLNLEHLSLVARLGIENDFRAEEDQFTKLTACYLENHHPENEYFRLPDDLAVQLFSSPRLRTMQLLRMEISGYVMTDISEQAHSEERREEELMLSSLEVLSLRKIRGLTRDNVISLICASPRLDTLSLQTSVSISTLTMQDIKTVGAFMEKIRIVVE